MPREICWDGCSLQGAYVRMGELTDRASPRFNEEMFRAVQQTAYSVSRRPENTGRTSVEIWNATKGHYALGICGGVYVGVRESREDTNLCGHGKLLVMVLDVFDMTGFGKPTPQWFKEHRHLFDGIDVDREVPAII